MTLKKIGSTHKKNKAVQRLRRRAAAIKAVDRKHEDNDIIDLALKCLYNNGDKTTRSLQQDVLRPHNIKLSEKEVGRILDIMINIGLAHPVIGFGNSGKISLTNEGYQLMNQYGSYKAYLEERIKQKQAHQPSLVMPQFFISAEEGENGDEDDKGEKTAAKDRRGF